MKQVKRILLTCLFGGVLAVNGCGLLQAVFCYRPCVAHGDYESEYCGSCGPCGNCGTRGRVAPGGIRVAHRDAGRPADAQRDNAPVRQRLRSVLLGLRSALWPSLPFLWFLRLLRRL